MKKAPDPMSNLPKELPDFIKWFKKYEKDLNRSRFGFDKGSKQQKAERLRINKEFSAMNRIIKKQENEMKRLKYNLRNILP